MLGNIYSLFTEIAAIAQTISTIKTDIIGSEIFNILSLLSFIFSYAKKSLVTTFAAIGFNAIKLFIYSET